MPASSYVLFNCKFEEPGTIVQDRRDSEEHQGGARTERENGEQCYKRSGASKETYRQAHDMGESQK